jgi:hypothetical protein
VTISISSFNLRSYQAAGMLGTENVIMEVSYPLLARDRSFKVGLRSLVRPAPRN